MAYFYPDTPIPVSGSANTAPGTPIVWKEITKGPASPKFTLETDRSTCTRVVDVSWDWVENFSHSVLGYQSLSSLRVSDSYSHVPTSLAYPYISRVTPWRANFGNSPNYGFMFASKMDIEGVGVPADSVCFDGSNETAIARYKNARCTILFTSRTYEILSDTEMYAAEPTMDESTWLRYVTKVVRPSGEIFTIQAGDGGFFYGGLKSPEDSTKAMACQTGINKLIVSFNLAVTWHQIPLAAVPSAIYNNGCANAAIEKTIGRVNDRTFHGMPQGTLLLLAAEIKPMVSPLGERIFDITYMFKYLNPRATPYRYTNSGMPPGMFIYAGHNHVLVPPAKQNPAGAPPDWFEALSNRTLAASSVPTNFIAKTDGVSIYDFRDFRYLFRPATYSL